MFYFIRMTQISKTTIIVRSNKSWQPFGVVFPETHWYQWSKPPIFFSFYHQNFHQTGKQNLVVSSCTGTQRNETLTNCVTTPCMDMKTIGIPPCTGTPGQPPKLSVWVIKYVTHEKKNFVLLSSTTFCVCTWVCNHGKKKIVLLHVPWFHFRTTQDYPDVRNTRQQIFIFGKAPSPLIAENWKSDSQQSIIPRVPFDYTKHFGIKKG